MNRSLLNRCVTVSSLVAFAVVIGMTFTALPAKAAVYTDALYDNNGGGDSSDISTVEVTNDATNLTFKITLNDFASIGPSANHYGKYEVGIQVNGGAGGQTAINTSGYGPGNPAYGNPYGNDVGISTGENFWIGTFLDDPTPYAGGAQLSSYSSVTGWSAYTNAPITEVYGPLTPGPAASIAFSFPLSAFGLNPGDSFKFDVWSTFGGLNGAYDALGLSGPTPNYPYTPVPYDAASTLSTYTVAAVPEPSSLALAVGGFSLMALGACRRALQQ